ncbi:flavin reductase [Pontibacter sp. G13]|uniref:flavin reductase family protein n=1 Tax=Pontibacter sp. G13 TaxID=3074898 RepID=UPI002889E884|nr:flavin reductase [Pontibacter sp. G13]WNJ18668.1 flavin reductase [Pontibacter sp. G13]
MSKPFKTFSQADVAAMDRIPRLKFINSISGFKSANLVGTRGSMGENLAIFSSVIHLGSNPAWLGMILRPATVPRHTWEHIQETGCYTINHITESMIQQAHAVSAAYGPEVSEFEIANLTPVYRKDFPAPFVSESPVGIGLELVETHEIGNGCKLIVGAAKWIFVEEGMFEPDHFVDLAEGNVVAIGGLDGYYQPRKLARFDYARPGQPIEEIKHED